MSYNKQTKRKQTKSAKFQKSAYEKNIHSNPMSNNAWTDLNSRDLSKLHDLCGKHVCKNQKMLCFTPKQVQMGGSGLKNAMKFF